MGLEKEIALGLAGIIALAAAPNALGDLENNPIRSIEHRIVYSNHESTKPVGPPENGVVYIPVNEPILVIDKSNYKLSVLEHRCRSDCDWIHLAQYDITIGRGSGDKQREGDNRTPEGNYRIIWLGYKYGGPAFMLDYPNEIDRAEGKTGGEILIHITDQRNLGKRGTQGCIGLSRKDIYDLKKYVKKDTMVLIRNNL